MPVGLVKHFIASISLDLQISTKFFVGILMTHLEFCFVPYITGKI